MSGHSKWSTIKRKKSLIDKRRGQLFTKIANMITAAARQGEDPETNFKLRLAIDKARAINMPSDNIERAINRSRGKIEGARLEEVTYEAYGPGGVALMIEVTTLNRNRTLALLRHILSEHGGRLGEEGSVKWLFEQKGAIRIENEKIKDKKEKVELMLIEAGIEDIKEEDRQIVIYTKPKDLKRIKEILEKEKIPLISTELELSTKNPIRVEDPELMAKIDKLMEDLDAQEDVTEIYSNVEN